MNNFFYIFIGWLVIILIILIGTFIGLLIHKSGFLGFIVLFLIGFGTVIAHPIGKFILKDRSKNDKKV